MSLSCAFDTTALAYLSSSFCGFFRVVGRVGRRVKLSAGGSPLCDSICLRSKEIMDSLKIIIEKHPDGYVAYPLGLKGVVVGEGDTYEEALADVQSAIRFHVEAFGREVLESESPVLEVFVAEARVAA